MKAVRTQKWLVKQVNVARAIHLAALDVEMIDPDLAVKLRRVSNYFWQRAIHLAIEPRYTGGIVWGRQDRVR